MSAPFAPESTAAAAMTDSELAGVAGIPTVAVTSFRAGIPHWQLERPFVMQKLATAIGADLGQMRANFTKAKKSGFMTRGHSTEGPTVIPGQSYSTGLRQ